MAEPDRQKIAACWAARGFTSELWTDYAGSDLAAILPEPVVAADPEVGEPAWTSGNRMLHACCGLAPCCSPSHKGRPHRVTLALLRSGLLRGYP